VFKFIAVFCLFLQKSFVIFQKKKDGKADDAFVSAN
jgi:hypothetical protein